MPWTDEKEHIVDSRALLEEYRLQTLPTDATIAATDPTSTTGKKAAATIKSQFEQYQTINTRLSEVIHEATPADLGQVLSRIGSLQQKVQHLEEELSQAQEDSEIAEQRNQQTKKPDQPISETGRYTGYYNSTVYSGISEYQGMSARLGIFKPLKMASVPILFGAATFLCIVAMLLLKDILVGTVFGPLFAMMPGGGSSSRSFLLDPRLWGTLFGAAVIVILFLTLKITGKLPVLPA